MSKSKKGDKGLVLEGILFLRDGIFGCVLLIGAIFAGLLWGLYAWSCCGRDLLRDWSGRWPRAIKCSRFVFAMLILALIISGGIRFIHFLDRVEVAQVTQEPIQNDSVNESADFKIFLAVMQDKYGKDALKGRLAILDAGHGAKAPHTKYGADPGTQWNFKGEEYNEAAIAARTAFEVSQMVIALGGDGQLVERASSMNELTGPRDPLPMPRDMALWDGSSLPNGGEGRKLRAKTAGEIANARDGKPVFISFHVDAQTGGGWSGLKVWHRRGETPRLAELMAASFEPYGYQRKRYGEPTGSVEGKNWDVLMNGILESVLFEMGVPKDPTDMANKWSDGDSWRLRNPANRWLMLERTIIVPLIQLGKEGN